MHPNISFGMGELYLDESRLGTVSTGQMSTEDLFDPLGEVPWVTTISSQPIEFSAEAKVDAGLLKELVEHDFANGTSAGFTLQYHTTHLEQIRRHKKKRINKKWAKRYGYREVRDVYVFENAHIEHELFNDF